MVVRGRNVTSPFRCLSATGPSVRSGDSSWIPSIEGLVDLLRAPGPRTVGARVERRTQFCLRWPFLALGLPFKIECLGPITDFSHLNMVSAPGSLKVLFIGLCGEPALPDTVRKIFGLGFSDGDPVAETLEDPVCRLGVLTMVIPPVPLLREPEDDTRLILMRSAFKICGIDSLFDCFSKVDAMLDTEVRLLPVDVMLRQTRLLL